jgi:dTDP-4-dehydrorhamnose reductase
MIQNRYLITGAGGQLGREWVNQLTMADQDVYAYAYEDLDVADQDAVSRIVSHVQPSVIINCAAYTAVDKAEAEQDSARLLNAIVPGRLASLCARKSIKLVHFSTDYIFGGTKTDSELYPDGFSEDHKANPQNVYGQTKWDGERSILASGCEHLTLRVSWLCGRFGHNFVKTMLRLGKERDVIRVVDDQVGCPSFAESVVANSLALIQGGQTGVFHLAANGKISWADFAQEIMLQAGYETQIERITTDEYPTPAKRPYYSLLNTSKAAAESGVVIEDWKIGLSKLMHVSTGLKASV